MKKIKFNTRKLFTNSKFLLLLSFVLACIFWVAFASTSDEESITVVSDVPVTISKSISTYGFTNEQKVTSITLDDVITATASRGTNTGKYYTNDQTWRFYQNEEGTLTISAADNYTIQSVKVTFNTKDNGVLKYSNTSISSNTNCNINAQTASFTVGSTSGSKGKVLVKAIEVVYQAD